MIRLSRQKWIAIAKTFLIILVATIISDWVTAWIPIHKLPVSHFWRVILDRSLTTILALIAMKVLYPHSLRRAKAKVSAKRLLIGLGIVCYLALPSLIHSQISSFRASQILEGLVFALFIGIDEEFFSRGFIYSSLEGYGVIAATIVSSVHFGLLHLGNIFWGGQSVSYTLAQVLSAGSFGYLAVGLMLYTRNIWVPILMHGLTDTPMQFEGAAQFTKEVTGHADWVGSVGRAAIYCGIAWYLIRHRPSELNPVITEEVD